VLDSVILVIYGWKSVQPGTLSWVFPSVAAATYAAHTMTNAVRWAIVKGSPANANLEALPDLAKARAAGGVLMEVAG
jgi:hypothetical protein